MGTTNNSFLLRIQQGQKETEQFMSQKQYNMAMVKARQTLEYMVNYLGEMALIVEGDLADNIDQLFEGHFISQLAKDHYHRIRILGNKAVHEGADSPYDAGEAFQLLSQEINAFANSHDRGNQRSSPINKRPADVRTISSSPRNNPPLSSAPRNKSRGPGTLRNSGTRTEPLRSREHTAGTRPDGAKPGQRPAQRNVSGSRQRSSSNSRSRRRGKQKGLNAYGLLKPALIFLVLLVLVLIIVKLISGKSEKKEPTTPASTTAITTETITSAEIPTEALEAETEAPKIYTTRSRLNVRSEPSTDGAKLETLASGTVVEYVRTYDDKWTVIIFEGTEAYVASEFLTVSEGGTGTGTGESTSAAENSTASIS
jgi:hypothetical protein